MKKLLFLLLFIPYVYCGLTDVGLHGIEWSELSGTTWGYTEELNIYQNVHHNIRFGYGDTIYFTKTYWDPTRPNMPKWVRYYRNPLYNMHWEIPPGPPPDDTNLVFQMLMKEYADSLYQQPVSGTSPLLDWFVWKVKGNVLYIGYLDEKRNTFYWEFIAE